MTYISFICRLTNDRASGWVARCGCGWRSGQFTGPLAEIDAADEREDHERQH